MKLTSSYSSILLGAVALSSMGDRANAQSIEDIIASINAGNVAGTTDPVFGDAALAPVPPTPVSPVAEEEVEPQEYVAPEPENFAAEGEADVVDDIVEDGVQDGIPPPPLPTPVPSAAPSAAPSVTPVPPKPFTCIDRSLEVSKSGPEGVKCIKRDEAICRGDWMFGIVPSVMDGTYQLTAWEWDAMSGYTDIAFAAYGGAEELCVGKTKRDKGDTSFMYVKTESDGTYYLVCDSVGKLSKNPKLKIRVRQDKEKRRKKNKRDRDFYDTIVKFRRGANDDDTLWSANTNGSESANEECYWKQVNVPPMTGNLGDKYNPIPYSSF